MRDLLDALDARLAELAVAASTDAPAPTPASAAAPRRPNHRRRTLVGSLATIGGAVAAVFALAGTSAAELPVFQTPPTDATALQRRTPITAPDIDFSSAHSFRTPAGPGYAVRSRAAICLIVPDGSPDAAGQYGATCGEPITSVERRGLLLQASREDAVPHNQVTFLLPKGAADVRVSVKGGAAPHSVDRGVVSADLPEGGEISWRVDERREREVVAAPARSPESTVVSCADGRLAAVERAPETDRSDAPRDLRAAQREACAR